MTIYHFESTVEKDNTKIHVALEMEINSKEALQALLQYVAHQNEADLSFYHDNVNDFKQYLQQYEAQNLSNKETQYLRQTQHYYVIFQEHGEALIAFEKEQLYALNRIKILLDDKLEHILDDNWQKRLSTADSDYKLKNQAILEIEISIHEFK